MFEKREHIEVEHISLARKADLVLVVPATANIIGKVANGIADDMLSTTIMATTSKGTIKYKIISRKNPQEPDGAPQYYAKAVQDRSMDFEDFVSHMSDHNSPFSRGVIHGVLTDMLDASNMKLDADLALVNARVNVIYNYYKMKYLTHTL